MVAHQGACVRYIYVDLDTKLIYTSNRLAANAAGVSVNTFNKWVNFNGACAAYSEYLSKRRDVYTRSKPKYGWITNRWVKLESSALLRMKNPIFAQEL